MVAIFACFSAELNSGYKLFPLKIQSAQHIFKRGNSKALKGTSVSQRKHFVSRTSLSDYAKYQIFNHMFFRQNDSEMWAGKSWSCQKLS